MKTLEQMIDEIRLAAESLLRERDLAQCEVARLSRENGDLCDRVAELEAENAELKRDQETKAYQAQVRELSARRRAV